MLFSTDIAVTGWIKNVRLHLGQKHFQAWETDVDVCDTSMKECGKYSQSK